MTTLPARGVHANKLIVGKPAPPIALHTLDGTTLALNDLRGQVVILTFWASWCEPCQQEFPLLDHFLKQHAEQGLTILAFSLDGIDSIPDVRKTAATVDFPVGLLGSPWAGGYGRIWRLPVSFVIDRDGNLIYNGWKDKHPAWTEKSLQQVVLPLLKRSPTTPAPAQH